MSKIKLVTAREYFTRVKSKTFLVTTLLAPIGIVIFYAALGWVFTRGSDDVKTIAVSDPSNLLEEKLGSRDNLVYQFEDAPIAALIDRYENKEFEGVLEVLPIDDPEKKNFNVNYHSDDQLALDESISITKAIEKKIRNYKLKVLDIDEDKIKSLETDVTLNPKTVKSTKKISSMTSMVAGGISMVLSVILFMIIILYGQQVMKSVMEEKINRIVEILISSIKPFELMMGKVLGVGLVGLTQIGIWAILFGIISMVAPMLLGIDMAELTSQSTQIMNEAESASPGMQDKIGEVMRELASVNWAMLIPLALLYFLGGYFMYAALFAAVGSAVGEDANDAQTLIIPVSLIMVFAFYIGISAMRAPDSSLAVWASIAPLLSPFVMPARLPFDPPMWQIGLSVLLMILSTILLVWLAARIYRVGILMYGKKASFKELAKWVFYKG